MSRIIPGAVGPAARSERAMTVMADPKSGNARRRTGTLVALLLILYCVRGISLFSQTTSPSVISSADVLQFLTRTIDWYHQASIEQKIATEPGDVAYVDDDRRVADQVVRLAFDFARQQADWIAKESKTSQPQTQAANAYSQYQSLIQAMTKADQQVQDTQAELQGLKQQLESAPAKKRSELQSQIAETESELNLISARRDVLHGMIDFANGAASGSGASGLRSQIEELARSVPNGVADTGTTSQPTSSPSNPAATGNKSPPSGIWGLAADLFHLSSKKRTLEQQIRSTDALTTAAKSLRAPLITNLRQMIQAGDQLAAQPDTNDRAALAQQKQKLDALTIQFKQLSAAVLPLSKQSILFELYKRNLVNWEDSIRSEYRDDLRNLLLRLGALAAIVGIIFVFGELWRRAIFRYVQDVRRRYQFLLLRRIVLWVSIILVLVFTFATEIGSIATFAGLITAGVAVALQNVIVSIVGYFFLIGKYGIRVGDRVQVGGVMGEVVDIGLARFHLMELSSDAPESQPTGRVVAFSNSVVFQGSGGLFKQIPGTSFVWHRLQLTFASDSDYHVIRERVNAAVDRAYADYRENLERQRRTMEQNLASISATELTPRIRLRFTPSGIEVMITFPVLLQKASEMDDRLSREVLAEVDREPPLKLLGSEIPTIKATA